MQDVSQFVLKRLRETAVAGSHPDADVLTAFAEQSLPVSERGRVIEHLAACGDCRDVVALALPATEIEVAPVSTTRARGWWLGLPVLRWGALAAGLTVAISIGVFQYSHRRNGDMVASNRAQEAVTLPSSSDLLHATQKESPGRRREHSHRRYSAPPYHPGRNPPSKSAAGIALPAMHRDC